MSSFLFELGFEEFPPSFIEPASEYFKSFFDDFMKRERIEAGSFDVFFTSSRIAVRANSFPSVQEPLKEKVYGAPRRVACDADGNLTKAGSAFLAKNGISDYFFEDSEKGEIIAGWREEAAKPVNELLSKMVVEALSSIKFKKSMRWAGFDIHFARPIRWILFLVDDVPMNLSFSGINFSSVSSGHRFMSDGAVNVTVSGYERELEKAFVIASPEKRREIIKNGVFATCDKLGGERFVDDELVYEVANCVEYPYLITGDIPGRFLDLPPELITLTMKQNQRFFAVPQKGGRGIFPHFISVLNNKPIDDAVVKKGNEKVLLARLSDAEFFYKKDKEKDFAGLSEKLKSVVFQKDLGSYYDKIVRIAAIGKMIGEKWFDMDAAALKKIETTAMLIKNDLVTGMVFEFPELQGVMGRYYALNAGFDAEIAQAVEDHYKPVSMESELPASITGKIVAMADRFDTIAGGFMAGLKPTGSKDKFAIRRSALSLLALVLSTGKEINIVEVTDFAASLVKKQNSSLSYDKGEILDFFKSRYAAVLGFDTPVVQAAVESGFDVPVKTAARASLVDLLTKKEGAAEMVQLFKRAQNIIAKADFAEGLPDEALFENSYERDLFNAVEKAFENVKKALVSEDIISAVIEIKPYLDSFFDNVMVMCDDVKVRNNRLQLVRMVGHIISDNVGDISYLNM